MTVHGRTGCGIPSGLRFGMRSRKDSDAVESWSCLRTGPDNIGLIADGGAMQRYGVNSQVEVFAKKRKGKE